MALLAVSQVRKTGLESLRICSWPHRMWIGSQGWWLLDSAFSPGALLSLPGVRSVKRLAIPPGTSLSCSGIPAIFPSQHGVGGKRDTHRSPQGPGTKLVYIHLSYFYLQGVASLSHTLECEKGLPFILGTGDRVQSIPYPESDVWFSRVALGKQN